MKLNKLQEKSDSRRVSLICIQVHSSIESSLEDSVKPEKVTFSMTNSNSSTSLLSSISFAIVSSSMKNQENRMKFQYSLIVEAIMLVFKLLVFTLTLGTGDVSADSTLDRTVVTSFSVHDHEVCLQFQWNLCGKCIVQSQASYTKLRYH
jgi:hypothetical protein